MSRASTGIAEKRDGDHVSMFPITQGSGVSLEERHVHSEGSVFGVDSHQSPELIECQILCPDSTQDLEDEVSPFSPRLQDRSVFLQRLTSIIMPSASRCLFLTFAALEFLSCLPAFGSSSGIQHKHHHNHRQVRASRAWARGSASSKIWIKAWTRACKTTSSSTLYRNKSLHRKQNKDSAMEANIQA